MEDIFKIYDNKIGISFQWKDVQSKLTQVIFRDTGFHLSVEEIELFIEKIMDAKMQKTCFKCEAGEYCKSILLQTPSNKVSMAVSLVELGQIEDLLKGTLFQLRMNNYLNDICKN
ncbi:hypothetical protein C7447_101209 [Tenacibaculum adriaticum]|uniref:Uncharacterized protein n=1 Tax=Tenacibaculum adriaticum TaxID=413713 RepID=A0A5S5DYC8_9FLAO|nr:hypothetical protein [Tenacibaculum adriaticum]TYP99609.1 hypothetical protein C7447_101209 [Tenacibaculum adriaticum]